MCARLKREIESPSWPYLTKISSFAARLPRLEGAIPLLNVPKCGTLLANPDKETLPDEIEIQYRAVFSINSRRARNCRTAIVAIPSAISLSLIIVEITILGPKFLYPPTPLIHPAFSTLVYGPDHIQVVSSNKKTHHEHVKVPVYTFKKSILVLTFLILILSSARVALTCGQLKRFLRSSRGMTLDRYAESCLTTSWLVTPSLSCQLWGDVRPGFGAKFSGLVGAAGMREEVWERTYEQRHTDLRCVARTGRY